MILRGFAAFVGATAILSLAVAPGTAATGQNSATHRPHRVAAVSNGGQPVQTREKTSQPGSNSAPRRITIVAVGPQAMAVQRYRDLAMQETG